MSDSDDTDILLLVPPDYFVSSVEQTLQEQIARQQQLQLEATELLNAAISHIIEHDCDTQEHAPGNYSVYDSIAPSIMAEAAANTMPPPPPATAAYQFLAASRKAELNQINARLHSIEREEENHFAAPSDISTISNCTVRNQPRNFPPMGLTHSTPKQRDAHDNIHDPNNGFYAGNTNSCETHAEVAPDDGVLLEIDNFLGDRRQQYDSHWQRTGDGNRLNGQTQWQASSLPGTLNRVSYTAEAAPAPEIENQLISLSEIWGKNGQGASIARLTSSSALQEEQLRRQHLEKTVRLLQSRLLEYQQRLSVAIEVDRTKDAALGKTQADCKSLEIEVQQLRDTLLKLESEHKSCSAKADATQKELTQAVGLATKFQEKNEHLESELTSCTRQSNERNNVYRQQMEELEIKMHGCKRSEEFAINELSKLKDRLAKAEYQNEKLKVSCEELGKDCSTLRNQKETLQEFHQKQKCRADGLETQRKSLQDTVANLTETETNLKRKLELQQKSLKAHYQQQLENVVTQKLKEFQTQLDKSEETLRAEARDRERLIAERAVKQLELMNEKSELELNLLQEKHNEEVELYRIQLANASKKIDDLELKLNCYKSKRADIAEKLHHVMEAQWQKALEILTSPHQTNRCRLQNDGDGGSAGEPLMNNAADDETDNYAANTNGDATYRTSKCIGRITEQYNSPVGNHREPQPMVTDRLQAYIELLLSKSPSDFDRLDEILALSTKARSTPSKLDRTGRRSLGGSSAKPPWKA